MTLFETGHANGTVSLRGLLSGEPPRCPDPRLTITDISERIAAGGWPGFLGYNMRQSLQAVRDYLEEIRRVDVGRVDTSRCGTPAVMGVIVGTGYGYVRDDGVAVIPIGALGP